MGTDEEAEFRAFVAGRSLALWRQAYVMCGDRHLAEDLVQMTLAKVYSRWRRIRQRGAVEAYTRKVLTRMCLGQLRSRGRRREDVSADPPDRGAAGGPQVEERMVLMDALRALAPRQRAVLVLRFWEDLSVEETAAVMGCAAGTVKSQSARGLVRLREVLGATEELLLVGKGTR
ncbi:DNA-directed RNA polymerase sigma-70 factor [Longispora fulva]|uniref:RNA polymerase sigma-70 factor (Sigma-E family) n=1 Tax=Longispora fulva TaxID=619741 RepID=A0A8J7G6W6_9ACTN|nr:SigE family RNA polymerase sigma factor [Longispora fulva]MBG6134045.1 RNA polymerase sigma-70 factor (sigma-E family) [Longispora fulva]GIG63563.1 DNA-directed RNA polymerase sigma-70 factor [Longispora fulva]